MRNKTAVAVAAFGLGAIAMIAVPALGAGNDKLMQVSMQMTVHMAGMPALPPHSFARKVCMPAGKFDADALQHATSRRTRAQCSVEHYSRHGNTITYDVICKVPEPIVSHAVIHLADDGGFTGTLHTTASAGGHAMTMDGTYTGKRIGSCTYAPPASS